MKSLTEGFFKRHISTHPISCLILTMVLELLLRHLAWGDLSKLEFKIQFQSPPMITFGDVKEEVNSASKVKKFGEW